MKNIIISTLCIISLLFSSNGVNKKSLADYKKHRMGSTNFNENNETKSVDPLTEDERQSKILNDRSEFKSKVDSKKNNIPENVREKSEAYLKSIDKSLGHSTKGLQLNTPLSKKYISDKNPKSVESLANERSLNKKFNESKNLRIERSSTPVQELNSYLFEKRKNILTKSKPKNFNRTLNHSNKSVEITTSQSNVFQSLNATRLEKIKYFQDFTRKATNGILESSTRNIYSLITIAQSGEKFYGIAEIGETWEEAHSQIDTLRALYDDFDIDADVHLVTINSRDEQDLIYQGIVDSTTLNRGLIGLTDEETEGDWRWVTGEDFSYSNWRNGEPNNAGNGEDHAVINIDAGGAWDDASGSSNWNYIVEVTLNMPSQPNLVFLGEYNGSEYAASYDPISYHDLPSLVENLNNQESDFEINMVTITSQEENEFLSSGIVNNDTLPSDARYWTGLTDHEEEGIWRWWNSDEEVEYYNWRAGEPNGGTTENYVEIKASDGLWNDANQDSELLYILEGQYVGNENENYLAGYVRDHATGIGIPNIYVFIGDQYGGSFQYQTDSTGYYMAGLPDDCDMCEYEVYVYGDGYFWTHEFFPAGSINGGVVIDYDLGSLEDYSAISGRIIDEETGDSLAYADAHITFGEVLNTGHQMIGFFGDFSFTGLPQDSVILVIEKDGYETYTHVFYDLQPNEEVYIDIFMSRENDDPPILDNVYTWINYNEETQTNYILSDYPRDWYTANNEIQQLRELYDYYDVRAEVYMVAIGSEEENQLISQSVMDSTGYDNFFIGLTDEGDEGNWLWLNGEELLYTNWADGEGDGGDRENFAVLHTPTMQWQDHGDGATFNYLVEITFDNNTNDEFTWLGEFEGSDYYLSPFEETWYGGFNYIEDNMEDDEEHHRSHLVTISSEEENDFLHSVLPDTGMYWIGFTDEINEGDWQWVTGEEVTYFNWGPGQPDGSGNYAVMNDPPGSGNWDDQPQTTLRRFILEVSTDEDDHGDDNMLANGGFEGSYLGNNGPLPDNWIGYPHQNSQLVQYFGDNIYNSEETFIPLEGDASLKMWGLFEGENTENNIFQEWQDGELEPGTNLFIEAALMSHFNDSIAVGGNTAFLFAKYFGPNYEFIGMETTEHFDGHHSTNNWHWKGFNAVVPENAFIVQVGAMLVQPTNEDHGSVYIDNFYMERTDGDDTEGELLWVGEFEGHHYYASTSRFLGSEVERLIDDLQSDNENNGLMIYPVSISSEEENQFISNALMNQWTEEETDTTLLIDDYWIGLSDQREENLWEWYNGEELVYTNWSEGEPNGSEDDFAVLWPESNQWASAGDDFMPLIIELEFTDSLNLRDIFVDIVNGSDEEGNGSFEFPFSSITRAVADANNGDQIFVAPGDYEEDVVMIELEDVLIYSMAGPADTRLLGDVDENNLLPAIAAVGSENVTIAGFTFTGSSGGAVDAFNTEDLYLFDNNFFNNYTPNSGGGLWSFGSSVQIANCMFENNYAGMDGGGIYFTQTTDSSLVRLDIFSSEFTDNEAIGRGGAIHVANMVNSYNMEVSITEVSFVGNVSTSSGGVLVHGPALLAMYRADFHNNFASEHSGALGLENNTYGYSDFGSFVGNHAANGHSGGVSMSSGSNLGLHYNTFVDNHSASGAHVTALGLASSQIHGTILWDYGSGDGSGVMVTELDGIGGNISIHESNVWNGESSYSSVGLGFVEYDSESNIEVNPFFCNLEDGDFSLDEMTPAITSDGMVMGAFGVGCSGNVMAPATIVSIDDIPEDQGGRVYVTFEKSIYDTDQPQRTEMYAIERLDGDTWVGLNSVLAYGSDLYVVEATTLGDSTSTDHMISEFRVIASMDEGIFISEPHSGFSIDDIAPNRLVNLVADHSNGIIYLNWDATDANDFSHYNIYYGRNQDFIPNSENLLGTHSSPNFEHDVAELGDHYYILSAVDIHENESEYSDVVSINLLSLLDVHGIPEAYTLHQNFPNPFNPTTQIKYDLPEDALVNINIFDVMGRMIRSLSYGHKSAGYHSLQWDATNDVGESVSAGMYIYTIQAGKYRSTKKMVLLK